MTRELIDIALTSAVLFYCGVGTAYAYHLDRRDPRRVRSLILVGLFWPLCMLVERWVRRDE